MKTKIVILTGILLVLAGMTACPKKSGELANPAPVADTVRPGKPFGYVLLDGLSLYSYDETKVPDKQWTWLLGMTAGKKVELLETEPIKIKKGINELEWYRIRYGDKEGYATKYYIGTFNTLAVVITDGAMRFKSPEITGVIAGKPLPRGTLITIPEEDLTADYCRAYAVSVEFLADKQNLNWYSDIYVKRSDISTQEPDVQSYLLYYIAKNMSDPKAKEDPKRMENLIRAKLEILNEAMKKYPFGVFADLIQAEINTLSGNKGTAATQTVQEKIEVYESPDFNSIVVGTIEAGTQLTIEEKSDVGGIEWVRISSPYVGWVLASQAGQ
ncbi:MAG TPA: SH3 domain-containing protein [Spirochaetia bacterium]|nr:SH3 domain-containing protein [Spirochaetales bacterium]HRS65941.1 SH3 domain-containing protein [Spirochaetia bacterium]HOT58056.1 SH3 domain-containing protein [Spirochaetales bacterium]HPD80833.1 SH3 domain-containing protein [Spirochaetales bacterium]HQK34908.1 SH3 domain-containing protein [Spirochaetales bacterium]